MESKPEPRTSDAAAMPLVQIQPDPPVGHSVVTCKSVVKKNLLLFLILTGAFLGFAIGLGVRELKPSKDSLMWIGMPGELFLRMLNLMIAPLVAGSIISGTSTLDPQSNGKISVVALTWVVCTNVLGCLFGVLLAVTIKPGEGKGVADDSEVTSPFETQDIFADLLRNIVPDNIVELGFRKAVTQYSSDSQEVHYNLTNGTLVTVTVDTRAKSNGKSDSVNVLGLIFVCLIFGIAANRMGEKAELFVRFFSVLTEIVLMVLRWFFWTTPVGVASLIAQTVAGISDLRDSFSKLGLFLMVVLVGVLVFQLVVLSLLLLLLTGRNPLYFHWSLLRPYCIGGVTSSSVTVSANGSAIFIASSAIFIAQYIGRDLSANDIIVVALLTAVSAMALPSVPSTSLVTLVIILAALNIPSSQIALLFTVEWLLDRVRTACNVVSHCYCAAVTYRFCKAGLVSQDPEEVTLENGKRHEESNMENGVDHSDVTITTKT